VGEATPDLVQAAEATTDPARSQLEAGPGPVDATVLTFPTSKMSLQLPPGVVATPPDEIRSAYEVTIAGATVWLNRNTGAPDTAEAFRQRLGGEILYAELDEEHSAFASRGSVRGDKDAIEVWGYAPGFGCQGINVTPDTLDEVFSLCASIRVASKPTEYSELPKIREVPSLGMATRGIDDSQFSLTRMEWSNFTCEFVLGEIRRPERERHVETVKTSSGSVRVWWETRSDRTDIGRTMGWTESGKYCCGFTTAYWFQPDDKDNYAPLIEACDNVEQDGWPEKFLPDPVK